MADIAHRDDLTYRDDSMLYGGPGRLSWGAIWAGVFTFWAIWLVFEVLAFAIFGNRTNPNAAAPVAGQSAGIAIWTIILTIIAMYVAGRETGHAAAVTNRRDGLMHGMIMFGLAVVSVLLLTSLFGAVLSGGSEFREPALAASPCSLVSAGRASSLCCWGGWPLWLEVRREWLRETNHLPAMYAISGPPHRAGLCRGCA